jgi:hypothetical protein
MVRSCSNEEVWDSRDLNMEGEESMVLEGHYQAMTGEDTADWEDLARSVGNCRLQTVETRELL